MAVPESVRIDITSLTYGNCENITIYWEDPVGGLKACDNQDYVTIEVDPDATLACIDLVIVCDDCGPCPPITKTICVCDDRFDCPDCHNCVNGICVSTCDELCVDDVCVECTENSHCQGGKVCVNGNCQCPPGYFDDGTGLCVQCDDTTVLDACFVCVGGFIQPVDCPIGHCNPANDECVECYNSTHCAGRPDGKNCCGDDFECECCPDKVWDQVLGICVDKPVCTFDTDCECGICVNGECVSICEPGQICVDDVCQDPCTGPDDCPDGYGCDGGVCVECATLACTGNGTRCEDVAGCVCNESAECEASDCPPEDQTVVDWDYTPGTSGQVQPGTGAPALEVIATAAYVGDVVVDGANGGVFANHEFSVSIGDGVSGTWTVQNSPSEAGTTYSGTSVSFDLSSPSSPVQYNFVMFQVSFVASDGRTATVVFWNEAVLTAGVTEGTLLAQNEWTFESRSTGIPDQVIGGTPGVLRLCASHSGVTLSAGSITGAAVSGNIQLTFTDDPSSDSCVLVNVTGCGVWDGTAVVECGNNRYTVDLPEYSREGTCCDDDIIDPLCSGTGSGAPCETITAVNVPLQLTPANGVVAGGRGEFTVTALWNTVLDPFTAFALVIGNDCWSESANTTPDPDVDDVEIITSGSQDSIFGIAPSQWSVNVTLRAGGCISFGKGCELRISGCKRLEGEICVEKCDVFSVEIFNDGIGNDYVAYQSLGSDSAVSFLWYENGGLTDPQNTTDTYTLVTPNTSITSILINASLEECSDTDTKTFVLDSVEGCTDELACDYNSAATVSGDCTYITTVGFSCDAGLILSWYSTGSTVANFYDVTGLPAGSTGTSVYDGQPLEPGSYTIRAVCGHNESFHTVTVPARCWDCNEGLGTCTQSLVGGNGPNMYATYDDCIADCAPCDASLFDVGVASACDGNAVKLTITMSGTGLVGPYEYQISRNDNGNIEASGSTAANPIVVTGLPSTILDVFVTDTGMSPVCDKTVQVNRDCSSCTPNDGTVSFNLAASAATDICDGNLTVTDVASSNPSAYPFTVEIVGESVSGTISSGNSTTITGISLTNDTYTVRVTDSFGCYQETSLVVSCTTSNCQSKGFNMSLAQTSYDGENYYLTVDYSSSVAMQAGAGIDYIYLEEHTHSGSTLCEDATTWTTASVDGGLGSANPAQMDAGPAGVGYDVTFAVPENPVDYVCYRARAVYYVGSELCSTIVGYINIAPPAQQPVCEFCAPYASGPSLTYDALNEEILVEYCFTQGPVNLTIDDPSGLATWQGSGGATTIQINGSPASGALTINAVAESSDRTITVEVRPGSGVTGCVTDVGTLVTACTCGINIISTSLDEVTEEVTVDWTASCTSGDVTVLVGGALTPTVPGGIIESGVSQTSTLYSDVTIVAVNSPLPDGGTYTVDISDNVLACAATQVEDTVPLTCNSPVGISHSTGTVLYEQHFENPTSAALNQAEVNIAANDRYARLVCRAITDQDAGGVVTEVDNTAAFEIATSAIRIGPSNTARSYPSTGGWLEIFRVFDAAGGGAIDIPLSPTGGANPADVTGPGNARVGVVPNDTLLTFDSTNPDQLRDALDAVIENYLDSLGYTYDTDYSHVVQVLSTGYVAITFFCKNAPVGSWVGVKRSDARIEVDTLGTGATVFETLVNVIFELIPASTPTDYEYINACATVTTSISSFGSFVINFASSDYDTIALAVAVQNITPGLTSTVGSCDYLNLSVDNGGDCPGVLYTWSHSVETTADVTVIEPPPSTTYQCQIDCADGCRYFVSYSTPAP